MVKADYKTYLASGVDIEAGNSFVDAIAPITKTTSTKGQIGQIGGFAAAFDPKAAGFEDPILLSATDGVGSKILMALPEEAYHAIGIDLVAMCVNDLIANRAKPLFFLDYLAVHKLDPDIAAKVIAGIADGCKQAGCSLIGGETAEMPGIYQASHMDMAGFAVGAMERKDFENQAKAKAGDIAIGLLSSGPHANGFSLIRNILANFDVSAPAPFDKSQSLAASMLAPTVIYHNAIESLNQLNSVTAIAHITGGGLIENPPRAYDKRLSLKINSLPKMPLFEWLAATGPIDQQEMLRVFNCGIGMVCFVEQHLLAASLEALHKANYGAMVIGELIANTDLKHEPVIFEI